MRGRHDVNSALVVDEAESCCKERGRPPGADGDNQLIGASEGERDVWAVMRCCLVVTRQSVDEDTHSSPPSHPLLVEGGYSPFVLVNARLDSDALRPVDT